MNNPRSTNSQIANLASEVRSLKSHLANVELERDALKTEIDRLQGLLNSSEAQVKHYRAKEQAQSGKPQQSDQLLSPEAAYLLAVMVNQADPSLTPMWVRDNEKWEFVNIHATFDELLTTQHVSVYSKSDNWILTVFEPTSKGIQYAAHPPTIKEP